MNPRAFVLSVVIMFMFPYAITGIPRNIREARLIEGAPRQTVTVVSKWTEFISPQADGYWIRFREPVASTRDVQVTSGEWKALQPGGRITIAVLPDGRPHTLESGGSVAFEQCMFVIAIIFWLAATANVIAVIRRWLRRRSRRSDPVMG